MLTVPERAGPANPRGGTPTRAIGSARRTTSIDTNRPHGLRRESVVDARARDVITDPSGHVRVVEQRFTATIGPDRTLLTIAADPPEPRLAQLVGVFVGPGFRAKMNATVPDHLERQSLLFALLDDLPGATLVSGYAVQRGDSPTATPVSSPSFEHHVRASEDMCAGWATDATIMVAFRNKGSIPAPLGPLAPTLEREDDPLSWHALAPLPTEATRRRRRLDLLPADGQWAFDSHFRDSYRDARGEETVIHEYALNGTLDDTVTRIGEAQTEARVLPWVECPGAVASSTRMAGQLLSELRVHVRHDFVGTTTCTHLNDAFRFLSDVLPLHSQIGPTDHS